MHVREEAYTNTIATNYTEYYSINISPPTGADQSINQSDHGLGILTRSHSYCMYIPPYGVTPFYN